MEFWKLSSFFFCLVLQATCAQDDPVVTTIYGDIRGNGKVTSDGAAYNEFKGIPFAKPPLGDLRWQKPLVPDAWDGIRDTQDFGSVCIQTGNFGASEDCLFVNVFVPASADEHLSPKANLPVLFFVHGGAFIFGSSNGFDGGFLSTRGQMVVVTTNYRLSTAGFLGSGTETAPGSYGLWDQIAALQWIQDNIAAFGGDATKVTIMGHSAGAASVSHLALSPAAKGLFQRVIPISGSAASYFGASSHQRITAYRLANFYQCPVDTDDAAMDCLRQESAFGLDLFGLALPPLQDGYLCTMIPAIDGELVSVKPIDGMESGLNRDYDLMTGVTMHDGASFVLPFTGSNILVDLFLNFAYNPYQNRDEIVALITGRFPGIFSEDLDTRQRIATKVATDYLFGSRAFKEAELHSQLSDRSTYLYEFKHQYSSTDPAWLEGVHGEDLPFIFGRSNFDEENERLSQYMQSFYINFVHTGNPNEGPRTVPLEWAQFDSTSKVRLVETPDIYTESVPQDLQNDYAFFNHIYDISIPRTDFNSNETSNHEMLEMWRTLSNEIKKAYEMTTN